MSVEWTDRELGKIARLYPRGGAKAVARELPHRTVTAIYTAARNLRIRRVGPARGRKATTR